jgi:uncharacterized protein
MKLNLTRFPISAILLAALVTCVLASCNKKTETETVSTFIFNPVDTSFVSTKLIIPGGKFKAEVLYQEGENEKVEWKNTMAAAKGMQDFLVYLPIKGSSTHGILWVNHGTVSPHEQIGDGGGSSVMEIYRDTLKGWSKVGFPYAINYGAVGGTLRNCSGVVTPWGTVLTSESIEPTSNHLLHPHDSLHPATLGDSSDFGGHSRWLNYGWMVEVDPIKREVLSKRTVMGRFVHQGSFAMPDERTIYMMDGEGPGAFFKFVADTARNLRSGQLWAFRHEADTLGSHWIKIPRGRDTLTYARRHAFQRGATIFSRLTDVVQLEDGTFLISESGRDSMDASTALLQGGKLAPHLEHLHVGNKVYDYKYGRILRYDPNTEKFTVLLEGGQALEDKSIVLSNPHNLAIDTLRDLLVIQEDIHGVTSGRIPSRTGILSKPKPGKPATMRVVNEIYFLDLKKPVAKLDDLHRFAVMPVGFKSTGAIFTPDCKSLIFSIQADEDGGVVPWDRSMTVVVTGFGD